MIAFQMEVPSKKFFPLLSVSWIVMNFHFAQISDERIIFVLNQIPDEFSLLKAIISN